jgi:radical SAM protein with 4Fe4S-binding SPASM domain
MKYRAKDINRTIEDCILSKKCSNIKAEMILIVGDENMVNLTALLSKNNDEIRYHKAQMSKKGIKKNFGPVVVWNITKECNLNCKHCYSSSNIKDNKKYFDKKEAFSLIEDFKKLNVPVVLISGGEPLTYPYFFDIVNKLREENIKVSISTNGILIDDEISTKLKNLNINYCGISIDGDVDFHNKFRGLDDAFERTIEGIRNCKKKDLKVGLRFTLTKENIRYIPFIFELMEKEEIKRICFYHLVPAGRGANIENLIPSKEEIRKVMDYIYQKAKYYKEKDSQMEILTVANHTDAAYFLMKMKKDKLLSYEFAYKALKKQGGNRSGKAICSIDWEQNIYIDQFSKFNCLGNIKENSFYDIWNFENEFIDGIRNRKENINQTCKACKHLDICCGNLPARSYYYNKDINGFDRSCYLYDEER